MKKAPWFFALSLGLLVQPESAHSFCGFYVAKADTKIFNKASQVVLARHDDKTVITMVNDFKGDPKEFAVVIPVPTLIEKVKSMSATRKSSTISTHTLRRVWSNISTVARATSRSWSGV